MATIGSTSVLFLALRDELSHFGMVAGRDVVEKPPIEMLALQGVILDADEVEDYVFGD
jgi:hypothetical protein